MAPCGMMKPWSFPYHRIHCCGSFFSWSSLSQDFFLYFIYFVLQTATPTLRIRRSKRAKGKNQSPEEDAFSGGPAEDPDEAAEKRAVDNFHPFAAKYRKTTETDYLRSFFPTKLTILYATGTGFVAATCTGYSQGRN